ncbi:MAG: amidophosphoribosyltransferase [Ruminococcaceae bacterium]|nr:amidophosphoribosyltransferase [Oscillospiraceae bacterium]
MNTLDFKNFDKIKEECGVFGIFSNEENLDVARLTNFGLFALQHRGQDACGIAINDNGTIVYHKNLGTVPEVFDDVVLNHLSGQIAVGHVRAATAASNSRENAQPLVTKYVKGTLTLALNGTLVNARSLREELEQSGALFQGTTDTEILAYLIAKERLFTHSVEDAITNMVGKLEGAYSFVVMSPSKLIGVRDPKGMKPLCLGKYKNSYVIASESVAFDAINAEFVRDIEPGEMVVITKDGIESKRVAPKCDTALCIFEHVYFARPDSVIDGASVYEARKEAGRYLARQKPVDADVVIAAPDSGISAAIGYSQESGIPYEVGLMKNRYIARTFIQPTQEMRENAVRIKLNALKSVVSGKRVILIDDSIVRGTTSKRVVALLREAGATEVHMRISSPAFLFPCYFGTDVGSQDVLVAVNRSVEEINELIGSDSLDYLTLENLLKTPVGSKCNFCTACFDGNYPLDVSEVSKAGDFKDVHFIKKLHIEK